MATEPREKIITYASYYDPMLAHLIRTKLEDNDIPCFVADENFLAANPIYNQAVGGIKLKIFERDLQRCREILADDEALIAQTNEDQPDVDTIICPNCGSTDVRDRAADKPAWKNLLSALWPFNASKNWHCLNCGKDFE